MSAVWDPDTLFRVDEGSGLGMFCVGLERSNYNSRCRLVLPEDRYNDIRHLLSSISTRLPQEMTKATLRRLARLGLCQYHGYQMEEIVAKWVKVLNCICEIHLMQRLELKLSIRDLSECKSLLGVKEDSVEALPVILRQHINNDAQLEKDLVASQATCARLQKDLARFKDQKKENSRLCAENSRLCAENSRLSTLLKRAEEEQERYKNQETNLTTECEKLRKQNTELQADVESAKDKYKDLQVKEQSATRELMATTAQLHEAQSLNLAWESDKQTLQSEIDILNQEVEELNDKNTSLSSQLASTVSSLETVTEELCAAHKEIMELRNKVTQLSTPTWYRVIQWLKQRFLSLRHSRNSGKEMSDEEEGMALAPTVAARDAGPA